jgi:RecA-family ATPase
MKGQVNIPAGIAIENNVEVSTDPKGIDAKQHSNSFGQISGILPVPADPEVCPIDINKERFSLGEILECKFDSVPFLVKGLIPAECISIIVGESDLGKSTLHTQLALSIVSGNRSFLGREINAKYNRVLIISSEEGIRGIGERIEKQCTVIKPDQDARNNLIIITSSSEVVYKIKKELKLNPVDLVVIDAFSDVYLGDMNISNKVRIFFNAFAEIIREFHCAIVFITHVGKSREGLSLHKNQVLGSVGIVDKARQVIMMSREKNSTSNRQLTIIKGNYVSEEEKKMAMILKFDKGTRTFDQLEERDVRNSSISPYDANREELENNVLKLRALGFSYEEIGNKVNRHKSSISRIIQKYPGVIKQSGDPDRIDDV